MSIIFVGAAVCIFDSMGIRDTDDTSFPAMKVQGSQGAKETGVVGGDYPDSGVIEVRLGEGVNGNSVSGKAPLAVKFITVEGSSPAGTITLTKIDFGDGSPTETLECAHRNVTVTYDAFGNIRHFQCSPPIEVMHTYVNSGTYTAEIVQGNFDMVILGQVSVTTHE